MTEIKLRGYKCTRCGHEWLPRKNKKPKVCPKCKSPYWDTPKRMESSKDKKERKFIKIKLLKDNDL